MPVWEAHHDPPLSDSPDSLPLATVADEVDFATFLVPILNHYPPARSTTIVIPSHLRGGTIITIPSPVATGPNISSTAAVSARASSFTLVKHQHVSSSLASHIIPHPDAGCWLGCAALTLPSAAAPSGPFGINTGSRLYTRSLFPEIHRNVRHCFPIAPDITQREEVRTARNTLIKDSLACLLLGRSGAQTNLAWSRVFLTMMRVTDLGKRRLHFDAL